MKRIVIIAAAFFLMSSVCFGQTRTARMSSPPSPLTGNATDGYALGGSLSIGTTTFATSLDPTNGVSTPQIGLGTAPNSSFRISLPGNNNWSTGGVLQTSTEIKSPLFSDSNDTNFFLNPNNSTISANLNGGVKLGSQAAIAGLTQYITFASGVSPAGSMTSGAIIYCTNGQLWVNGTAGDHTQITPHDPVTGEIYINSYNSFTGQGIKYYPKTNTTITYTVPKINPEDEHKKAWAVANPTLETSAKEAALEPTTETVYEVVPVKDLDPATGTIVNTYEQRPLTSVQVGWKLKDGYAVNKTTGSFEKKTLPDAAKIEAECPKFEWEKQRQDIRAAWGK